MDHLITTPCGMLRGTKGRTEGTVAYKGIRYATARRFEYPDMVTHWDGIYDATEYGNCAYQPRAFYDEEKNEKKYFYYHEFRKGETYTYSDDCLFLNVFTPEDAKPGDKLPVLVYIHGGGFTGGCAHEKHFDEPVWAQNDIIGVTIQYRLGPMGFLCLPQLIDEAGHTGNYGLYDQVMALKWIQANIEAFGGDANNITIMGQSAGAMSVQILSESPLTHNLFQKAILSSGCGMIGMMTTSVEKSCAFWEVVMKNCGCADIEELRALPADVLFEQWQAAKKTVKGGVTSSAPVKDGLLIGENKQHDIPYMAGVTSHDMAPPILMSMTRKWVEKAKQPSYTWLFDRMLPGDKNGAWHSSDLWYWFGTLDNCWRPMEEKDRLLSKEMIDYLCAFVRTGDPNGEGRPQWIPAQKSKKKALILGENSTRMAKPPMLKLTGIMLTNKAVGE